MRHPLLRSLLRLFFAQFPARWRSLAEDRQGAGRTCREAASGAPLSSAMGMAEKSPLLDAMQRDAVKPPEKRPEKVRRETLSVDNPGDSPVDNLGAQRKTKTLIRPHARRSGCERQLLQIAYIQSRSSEDGPPSLDGHSLWITPLLRVESQASSGPSYRGDASHRRPGESKATTG